MFNDENNPHAHDQSQRDDESYLPKGLSLRMKILNKNKLRNANVNYYSSTAFSDESSF